MSVGDSYVALSASIFIQYLQYYVSEVGPIAIVATIATRRSWQMKIGVSYSLS